MELKDKPKKGECDLAIMKCSLKERLNYALNDFAEIIYPFLHFSDTSFVALFFFSLNKIQS